MTLLTLVIDSDLKFKIILITNGIFDISSQVC